ncbi:hypothetical protein [Flavobacterium beibuense]|uniref:Lipoprotein n=1 Tax=Flavobacterium beibuense TaxID=657326 RepID=A0A444WC51_9FLAO|nr:hypothetical protein [Flavobacterium beibuense]RYJ43392.1 hypothetical protein NU09_1730 [Flavobacterium beibuense]
MIRFLALFLLLINLSSCGVLRLNESDAIGEYKVSGDYTEGILNLNKDKSFDYKYFMDVGGWCCESKGEWRLYKGKLILKSYQEYKEDYILVRESTNDDPHIELFDEVGALGHSFGVYLEGKYFSADDNGRVDYENIIVDSIKVNHYGLSESASFYRVVNKNSNTFYIKIKGKTLATSYFDDSFRITKNFVKIKKLKYRKIND